MSKKDLLGYGAATIADSGPYNFTTCYLILFLTTVVGMSPERSGTISSVVILADGITGALIGYISDYTGSKHGRRRPYLFAAVFPLAIGLCMLFSNVPLTGVLQTAFYVVFGIMFWLGFSMYYTPYTALGAEITDDYNERSVLRTVARYFGIAGNLIGTVVPLLLVGFMTSKGISEGNSWFTVAALVAVLSGAGILITWKSTEGKENMNAPTDDSFSIPGLIREYTKIALLKPFKYLVAVIGTFTLANTFYTSSMVFFARYNLGMGDEITSAVFLISIITNLVLTPVIGFTAVRFGKRETMLASMALSGAGCIFFYFIGIKSFIIMGVYAVIFSVAYTCFWQLINAIMYDMCEVAEFRFGKRLEGSVSSVYGLVFTLFTSVATQALGWILKFEMVTEAFILIPGIMLLATALFQALYPLDEKTFNKLKKAIEIKKSGKEPDIEGLKKII